MRARALLVAVSLTVTSPAAAEPTRVVVTVLSQDGKFVGDHTGGARVTFRNAKSGSILAEGVTKGGTGNTDRIMQASGRSPLLKDDDAASFDAILDVAEPTLVDLEVAGPLGRPQSLVHVRSQRWIVPGEAVDIGNGWMVELPGLAVTPTIVRDGSSLEVQAKVELLCGCPITPGGLWDAADYKVTASLWSAGRLVSTTPLAFRTTPGVFGGLAKLTASSDLRLYISATNIKTGNSGTVTVPVS